MEENSTGSAPFDGPTINGHPALSVRDVQQWFVETFGITPAPEQVVSIAQNLNHCALFAAQWKDTTEFKEARRNDPSTARLQSINEALTTLQNELPVLINDTLKIFPNSKSASLIAARTLLDSVNSLAPAFQKFERPGRGSPPKSWHSIARNLVPPIITALESSGIEEAGFGQPTSPAVTIMQSALAYLGVHVSLEAIVDALRNRKKTAGKIPR